MTAATGTLTVDRFAKLLNETFGVEAEAGRLDLVLTEASARGGRAFSLVFRGPRAQPLEQRTYAFSHPAMGTVNIFIVPIGADRDSMLYEAVFNN